MSEITLENVETVKDRMGVSYAEAKDALEITDGDVLEAIIYLEKKIIDELTEKYGEEQEEDTSCKYESIDEFKIWLKDLINKGNITRVKIKKDERVLVDVPVNAGIAAGVIAIIIPQLIAIGIITAIATQITIEITKNDGTVEVVNKMVAKAAKDVSAKTQDVVANVKSKVASVKSDFGHHSKKNTNTKAEDDSIYSYTVNFDEKE